MVPQLAAVFATQGGRVRRGQALELGETAATIAVRLALSEWTETRPDVYALSGVPDSDTAAMWDLVLSMPTGRVRLARATAARMHAMSGFVREWPCTVEAVVQEDVTRRNGVQLWRATDWDRRSEVLVDGLPVTPRVETVADLAATNDMPTILRVLQDEVFHARMTVAEARQWLGRGRRGSGVLREACDHLDAGRESILSVIVFDICIAAGFPEPDCNVEVVEGAGFSDLAYIAARTVIEPRGYGPHGQRKVWDRDFEKIELHRDGEFQTIGVRWVEAVRFQGRVANRISRPLARAGLIPAPLALPPAYVLVPRWSERYGNPVRAARKLG